MPESFIARLARGLGYAVSGGDAHSWFGPQAPLPPAAPPDVAGRQFDYPFGFNLAVTPRGAEPTGFAELRALADAHDLLRLVQLSLCLLRDDSRGDSDGRAVGLRARRRRQHCHGLAEMARRHSRRGVAALHLRILGLHRRPLVGKNQGCQQVSRPYTPLVPRGSAGLCCDSMRLALGAIPLVAACRDERGWVRYAMRPEAELRSILRRIDQKLAPEFVERCVDDIERVAAALNSGEEWRARITATRLELPKLLPADMAMLATCAVLDKAGFNSAEPRLTAGGDGRPGEWTFAIPAYRAQVFAKQKGIWERFHKAARKLRGQSSTQFFAYGETFAGEGGMRSAGNSRVAGLDQDWLDRARDAKDASKKNPLFPSLAGTTSLNKLTPEQVALIYRYYARDAFDTVGGSAALDKVGNKYSAAALFDTMLWEGKGAGSLTIQKAINEVAGAGAVPQDSQMGPATLDAYAKLALNPATRAKLLDALAQKRTEWAKGKGQYDPARIEHFRYLGVRD